ncbi:hypothetical protein BGZ82_011474 [Podila clonocystis]|nr:hypothetical protein BGZ82_011474 [Podila clonocystis]
MTRAPDHRRYAGIAVSGSRATMIPPFMCPVSIAGTMGGPPSLGKVKMENEWSNNETYFSFAPHVVASPTQVDTPVTLPSIDSAPSTPGATTPAVTSFFSTTPTMTSSSSSPYASCVTSLSSKPKPPILSTQQDFARKKINRKHPNNIKIHAPSKFALPSLSSTNTKGANTLITPTTATTARPPYVVTSSSFVREPPTPQSSIDSCSTISPITPESVNCNSSSFNLCPGPASSSSSSSSTSSSSSSQGAVSSGGGGTGQYWFPASFSLLDSADMMAMYAFPELDDILQYEQQQQQLEALLAQEKTRHYHQQQQQLLQQQAPSPSQSEAQSPMYMFPEQEPHWPTSSPSSQSSHTQQPQTQQLALQQQQHHQQQQLLLQQQQYMYPITQSSQPSHPSTSRPTSSLLTKHQHKPVSKKQHDSHEMLDKRHARVPPKHHYGHPHPPNHHAHLHASHSPSHSHPSSSLSPQQQQPLEQIACPHCGKQYASRGLLRSHIVSHLDDKPFVCRDCVNKRYKRNHDLLRHRREKH